MKMMLVLIARRHILVLRILHFKNPIRFGHILLISPVVRCVEISDRCTLLLQSGLLSMKECFCSLGQENEGISHSFCGPSSNNYATKLQMVWVSPRSNDQIVPNMKYEGDRSFGRDCPFLEYWMRIYL